MVHDFSIQIFISETYQNSILFIFKILKFPKIEHCIAFPSLMGQDLNGILEHVYLLHFKK